MAQEYLINANRNIKRKTGKLIGKIAVVKPIMDRLGIGDIVNNVTNGYGSNHIKVDNSTVGEIITCNRLAAPKPLYRIEEWVDDQTCIGDVYNLEKGVLNDDRIVDMLDEIHPKLSEAWDQVITNAVRHFDIPLGIFYHDITSFYFEGDYDNSEIIEHGYSRDNKPDKKQINLDVNINNTQIPVMYRLLSGSTSDKATAIKNMEDLLSLAKKLPEETDRMLVVGDRMLLDDNIIVDYHKHNIDYLGPLKLTNAMKEAILDIPEENYIHISLRNNDGLYSGTFIPWTFTNKDGKSVTDRVLVVKSLQKAKNDKNSREKKVAAFEEALRDLQSKLNGKRYKTVDSVEKRLEQLRKQYKCPYIIAKVSETEDGKVKFDYYLDKQAISRQEKLDGKYMMSTNRDTLTDTEMINIYKGRDKSEKAFSITKGPLKIRPVYLQKDTRIESLVFFIMCALLVYSILRMMIKDTKLEYSITNVMRIFEGLTALYTEFNDGSIYIKCSDLRYTQVYILQQLGLKLPSEYVDKVIT